MKALVIDDSRAMRAYLARLLRARGFDVAEAEDGLVALQKLATMDEAPDLALVDVNMPRMTGHDVVRLLRSRPDWSSIRIVMVTSEPSDQLLLKAIEFGADSFVRKPVDDEMLDDKLGEIGLSL